MKQRAKYKIIKSLIELLEYYPFDEITIKMICAYSGVNRSTFYEKKLYKFFLLIAKYIKRKEAFYRATLVTYPNKDIALDYINATKTCYEKVMNRYETSINNKRMFIIYSVGGQAGVFIDWLRNGCIESPQEVAQVLLANTIKLQR